MRQKPTGEGWTGCTELWGQIVVKEASDGHVRLYSLTLGKEIDVEFPIFRAQFHRHDLNDMKSKPGFPPEGIPGRQPTPEGGDDAAE